MASKWFGWHTLNLSNFPAPPRRLSQHGGSISGDWLRLMLQEVGRSVSPGSSTTSTRRIMPKTKCASSELASLLDGSTAGELFSELARYGLQQLIALEVAAVIGADRHERTEERHGYRNGYRRRSLTIQVGRVD